MSEWISGLKKRDLTSVGHHNGTFSTFLGVVLHVNVSGKTSQGTSPDWYAAGGGPDEVCPNFQVMRDGTGWQLLPMNVQPWTQATGNFNYASIETGGDPDVPLSAAQIATCAKIIKAYHVQHGMVLQLANKPGQTGFGIHSMGGADWGGHSCPGAIRAAQRAQILTLAAAPAAGDLMEEIMSYYASKADFEAAMTRIANNAVDRRLEITANIAHGMPAWFEHYLFGKSLAADAKGAAAHPGVDLHKLAASVTAIQKKVGA